MDEKALQGFLRSAASAYAPKYTRFLDPAEAAELKRAAKALSLEAFFWGGYPDAERCLAAVGGESEPEKDQFPLTLLESPYNSRFSSITHRDVLGAYMALGLTRDCIGDIIIRNEAIYLCALETMADFICESLHSAGRVSLSFRKIRDLSRIPPPEGSYFRGTVSSLRLDAVLAEGFRISRTEAAELIRSGRVKLNYLPIVRTDAPVSEGAMLSLAGHGRVSLRSIDGLTKKQRIGITFFRYQ